MGQLAPEIFKAYDIRGVYGKDIDADAAHQIGRAFVRVIGELEDKPTSRLRLGLGRDMRLTAPNLEASYREGMLAEGATVLEAGEIGTDAPRLDVKASLASSPLVIAGSEQAMAKLGWPVSPVSWTRVVDPAVSVTLSDPTQSTEGLATLAHRGLAKAYAAEIASARHERRPEFAA